MLNDTTAANIRSRISDFHTLNVSDYDPEGFESLPTPGTSHVVTADAQGMAITLTSTVNLLFGSMLMVPETGVIMNDEMNDFSVPEPQTPLAMCLRLRISCGRANARYPPSRRLS
jgi:gamma-glutamyltranspeptidase/glutathione hydrolase